MEPTKDRGFAHGVALFCILVFGAILLRNAWICDDAFITWRTVDNFVHGHGLRWNIDERVQTYTHPFWLLLTLLCYSVTGEFYFTVIALSMILTIAAFAVAVYRLEGSLINVLLTTLILIFSKAFVDYATSGLENPLSFLLVVLFAVVYFRQETFDRSAVLRLALITALAAFNRLDSLVLFLPALAHAVWKAGWKSCFKPLLLGFSPLIAWEIFSTLYYGFPFPNTAYAKLGVGISTWELAKQGFYYFTNSLNLDPLTLLVIWGSTAIALFLREVKAICIFAGIWIYLLYVLSIGGDFMSGRFFALPLFVSAVLVRRFPLPAGNPSWAIVAVVAVIGLSSDLNPIASHARYINRLIENGIADERGYYSFLTGILNMQRNSVGMRRDPLVLDAEEEQAKGSEKKVRGAHHVAKGPNAGSYGYYCGPDVHVVDTYALVDPLMARLPAYYNPNWRVGHFSRFVPPGYLETLEFGTNMIRDKDLAAYYDKLAIVTRGPIFGGERLWEVVKMNLGLYDHLIDKDLYRFPDRLRIGLSSISSPKKGGTPRRDQGNRMVPNSGMEVSLGRLSHAVAIEVSMDQKNSYSLSLMKESEKIYETILRPTRRDDQESLVVQVVDLPTKASDAGYDTLVFLPLNEEDVRAIGHVRLIE